MLRSLLIGSSLLALLADGPAFAQEVSKVPLPEFPDFSGKGIQPDNQTDLQTASEDDLYRAVFGKDKPDLVASRYQVMIDGVILGEALIEPTQEGWVERSFIEKQLLPTLLPEAAERLKAILSLERISFSSLRSLSYEVSFNARDLILSIHIPMDQRSERTIVLRGIRNQTVLDPIKVADVSGFLSVRSGAEWIQTGPESSGSPSGLTIDFDSAINVKGIVAEGSFRYTENSSRRWIRDDVRLVYDDVDSLVRYQLGDIRAGLRPEQNAPRIAGISAHREFRINPYDDPRPSGERGLVLDRPAQVEVIVNGASVRSLNLSPGRYSLTDFPIMPGAVNDVEFIVTYATGEVERISFPAFLNIELLDEGLSEFSVNLGVPYTIEDQVRDYDTSEFNLIGFYRRGMTQDLTLGGSFEISSDLALIGPQVAWASPFGNFDLSVTADAMNPSIDSSRLLLRHAWRGTNPDEDPELDTFIVLTGKDYRTLDRLFDSTVSTVFAQSRMSFPLGRDTRLQFGGSYERVLEDRIGDRWTAGISGSQRIGRASVISSLDWVKDQQGSNFAFRISAFLLFGRTTVTSSYASRGNAFRTEIRQPSGFGVGSFGYSGGFELRDGANRQFARANYVGNRFEAGIQQERFDARGSVDTRSGFSLGSAIVMADGNFAVTRPVENSFAIISNASSIEADIAVEPRSSSSQGIRYSGKSGWLGDAVVPDLPAYLYRDLEVEAPDAPVGAGIGGDVFTVQPRYKSGFFLESGAGKGSVSILGDLVDRNGAPLSLAVGTMKMLSGQATDESFSDSAVTLFTNSAGRFFVEGLEPGKTYEAFMEINGESIRFEISIPDDAIGIFRPAQKISINVSATEKVDE